MGCFKGVLFACCTASLVVGSNVKSVSNNARLSDTYTTNERYPVFSRRDSPFRNDTRTFEIVQTTPTTSTTRTLCTSTTTSKPETNTPSTALVHVTSSSSRPDPPTQYSAVEPEASISRSSNAPSSAVGKSATVSHTITEAQRPSAPSSISTVSETETLIPSRPSSDVKSTANTQIPSTTWAIVDSSSVSSIPLPTITYSAMLTPHESLSISPNNVQHSTQSSNSSLMVSATKTPPTKTTVSLSDTASFTIGSSSQQNSLSDSPTGTSSAITLTSQTSQSLSSSLSVNATAITFNTTISSGSSQAEAMATLSLASLSFTTKDSTSRTITPSFPTLSIIPTTTTKLLSLSVSSLTSWLPSSSASAVIGSSILASLSASVTDTAIPTSVVSQPAQSSASTESTVLSSGQSYALPSTSTAALSVSTPLESSVAGPSPTSSFASNSLSQTTNLSTLASLSASTASVVTEPSSSSARSSELEEETSAASVTASVQSSSAGIGSSTLGGSGTTSISFTLDDPSRSLISTASIMPIVSNTTTSAASIATTSVQATGSTASLAPVNSTVSSSLALETTSLGTSSLLGITTSESSSITVETSSFVSSASDSFTQTLIVSMTSQFLSTATSVQATEISDAPLRSSNAYTIQPTTASETDTSSPVYLPLFPSLSTAPVGWTNGSTSSATGTTPTSRGSFVTTSMFGSFRPSRSGSLRMMFTSTPLSITVTTAISSNPKSTGSFITNTKTKTESSHSNSPSTSISKSTFDTTMRTQVSTYTPTSSATKTEAAAAPKPLTPSQTAGVAIGSTAGILLAIVAAIFVARRYHHIHLAKRGSGASSGIYPKVAYLYDPSLGGNGGGDSGDDDAMDFMSGGAGGMPSTGSRTPPRAPQNSLDYEPPSWFNINETNCSDPGNPFGDPEDPFMDWRSSDAIGSPSDAASALAAAVAEYGAGPQRSLPPVPVSSTPLFRDHIIPSPTLSPIINGCSLRRCHAISSRRSSVKSQRSLRSLRNCPSPDPESKTCSPISPYRRGPTKSLASINETHFDDPFPDPIEHDLLLPVDVRSETPDSVLVYAPAPVTRTPVRPALSTIPSEDHASMTSLPSIAAAQPRSTGSILFPTAKSNKYSYTSLAYTNIPSSPQHLDRPDSDRTITQSTYFVRASSPNPTSTSMPRNKGWEEIKRTSNGSSSLMSSRPPTPPLPRFASPRPNLSPPPPLKKRSLIQLRRKTPLAGTGQLLVPAQNTYASPSSSPLTVNTSFVFNSNTRFEGPRMSLLAKVNSMSDMRDEAASPRKKNGIGLGIGYRDSLSRRAERVPRWCPEDVGKKF